MNRIRIGLFFAAGQEFWRSNCICRRIVPQQLLFGTDGVGWGLLFGSFTLFSMFFNGLHIGAITAVFFNNDLGADWIGWLSIHGVTELGAIFIAGGGGLLIARTMIFTKGVSMARALRDIGPQIAVIAMSMLVLLGLAALIEGYLRQLIDPMWARYTIGWGWAPSGWPTLAWQGGRAPMTSNKSEGKTAAQEEKQEKRQAKNQIKKQATTQARLEAALGMAPTQNQVHLISAEGVPIQANRVSPWLRLGALGLDVFLQFLLIYLVLLLLDLIPYIFGFSIFGRNQFLILNLVFNLFIVFIRLPYFLLQEYFLRGQTLGKRLLGLRVWWMRLAGGYAYLPSLFAMLAER